MFANRWSAVLAFAGLCVTSASVSGNTPAAQVDINTSGSTSLMIYQDYALVRKSLSVKPDDKGILQIVGMPDEWRYDSLELDYQLASGSLAPRQMGWHLNGLSRDAIYRSMVGKAVELLGGGLNAPMQGTLLFYRSGLGLVQGRDGRQFVVDWDDPQGIRMTGKDSLTNEIQLQSHIYATFEVADLDKIAEHPLRLSYVTPQLRYSSHYRLTLEEKGKARIELNGLLVNNTDASYNGADIRLVSGDTGRRGTYGRSRQVMMEAAPAMDVAPERVGEMLVQSVPEGTSLPAHSQQQLSLMRKDPLTLEKIYTLDVYGRSFTGRNAAMERPRLSYRFKTDTDLPAAVVKLFEETSDGSLIISGDSWMSQTTAGDFAHLTMGEAQAVRVQRTLVDSRQQDKALVSQWNIVLLNDQDEAVTVVLMDRDNGLQKISEIKGATLEGHRSLKVKVPARGKTQIGYHGRYSL